MGAGASFDRSELAALSVSEVAHLVSTVDITGLSQYRQACIDFGIDGDMLTRLPRDQLADALRRAGVGNGDHLEYLLEELENIRSPKIDERKLDRDSLLQFIEQTNSNNNQQSYNWDEWSNTSDWTGVFLDNNDRVTGIDLTNGSLSGELPASLGEISCLEQLHATSNHFTGTIPEAIGGLSRLVSLRLNHNNLSGRLPGSLTCLTSLTVLNLAHNNITGTVPVKMGTMTTLRKLSLGSNKLNGSIPKELGTLHFVVELRIRENNLAGKIPPLLGNMRSLQALDLTSNMLQGHIPESFGSLTALRELWLGGNLLVGGIPESLSKLKVLQSLDLSSNRFAARLPGRVFSALSSSLAYLNISRNAFEGGMPLAPLLTRRRDTVSGAADTDSSADGEDADDADNGASFHWGAEVSSSPLSYVNLSHNQLTGPIPEGIRALTSLDTLELSHNKLEGGVPSGIGSCGALRILSLSRCGLSGRLDSDAKGGIGRLTSLESLRLDGNLFEGDVPSLLGALTRLEVIQLQDNCFSGYLPSSLGQLDRLWTLVIRNNQLSGRIPESLGHLTGLRTLRVDENRCLQGPIPQPLACRPECLVSADERVLEDTEASMLGCRLSDWRLVPRKAFLNLAEFPGYAYIRASLVTHASTLVPYECHVFVDARGKRLVVRRTEIAFFSHCWDLPPEQCPPKPGFLEGPHPDTPDRTKLRHMKACLQDAPSNIQYVWLDMLCVPLEDSKRRRAAGRSVPFFVHNSGRFYILAPDTNGLQRYRTRAWCRLEVLCAACPYQGQTQSAFSSKSGQNSRKARFVFDSVECFSSMWEKGDRIEQRLGGGEALAAMGFLRNAAAGKLSDPNDRQDVAEAALRAINAMELSGRLAAAIAQSFRFSCKRVLYGTQGWEGDSLDEELSLQSDMSGRRSGLFSRSKITTTSTSSAAGTGRLPHAGLSIATN